MPKQLRDYQKQVIKECLIALKEDDRPVLMMASVGSGKSLMLSEILLIFERAGKHALCLVNNAELIRNNAKTFEEQGGNPAIYCASLGSKKLGNVVFGTPQSVLNSIKRNKKIASIKFNIIVVDEAHAINYKDHASTFMRILRHYKQEYPSMRVLGATGTNFRFRGEAIVGDGCLFKKQVGNISTYWLIDQGYLVKPEFYINEQIDFSSVKVNTMGRFEAKQLESVLQKNKRLTGEILENLQVIMQNRFGCFIFCCTKRHCEEALDVLPKEQSAIITADTTQKERIRILEAARKGDIKYLINVQVLTVGIDVPGYDTILFLRPTESLVLAVQMIGRALRLYPNKESALILDCAGNLDRHSDWEDPIIMEAIKQTQKEIDRIFPCPECETLNGLMARRCIGIIEDKRCDYYFDWKDCPECSKQVDITSRYCIHCEAELIDPNTKLSPLISTTIEVNVDDAAYWINEKHIRASYTFNTDKLVYEFFSPFASEKAKNYFYGYFIRNHFDEPSKYYPLLNDIDRIKELLKFAKIPAKLKLKWSGSDWKIDKKYFNIINTQPCP